MWPEYREYERAMTTLVDAFVKPHMRRYLSNIDEQLPEKLREKPFLVMQSSGGVLSSKQVADKPISTALSGPAAGVIGATEMATLAGFHNVVTLDAGGTSTDICLVENSAPRITTSASVGPFPVRLPMIDIRTVGTGGGSIAWISREGQLKVGPISAGSTPGPMCYPNGGDQPTITDANVVMGRLPAELIGGDIQLNVKRAYEGIAKLAGQLKQDISVEDLAEGIIEIANWNQANLIRQMTIEQGIDPREFALLSFGGSGPAQSPAVMDLLNLKACLVPPNPGNLSAFGLLMVDYRSDHVFTKVVTEDDLKIEDVREYYSSLEEEAASALEKDGIARENINFLRQADLRYAGQSTEVRVNVPGGVVDQKTLAQMIENFHLSHEHSYGFCYRDEQQIEIVNFAVSSFSEVAKPQLKPKEIKSNGASVEPKATRPVYLEKAFHDTPIYDRDDLQPGSSFTGPLVIEEFGSTTVVFPGQKLDVDAHGILIIRSNGKGN